MTNDHVASDAEIAAFVREHMWKGCTHLSKVEGALYSRQNAVNAPCIRIVADPVRLATLEEIAGGLICCRAPSPPCLEPGAALHKMGSTVLVYCKEHAQPGDLWLVLP